jgi:hypothetical protein
MSKEVEDSAAIRAAAEREDAITLDFTQYASLFSVLSYSLAV